MELIKKGKTILYPVCKVEKEKKMMFIYEFVKHLVQEDPIQYNTEYARLLLVIPYFKKEIHNGFVYAPYPFNETIKKILSDYEIKE